MRLSLFLLLLITLVIISSVKSERKRKNDNGDRQIKHNKYEEAASQTLSRSKKPLRHTFESSEEEISVMEYRKRKEEMRKKKTLGDVFQEKKEKKKAKKERFKKNVLKYFDNEVGYVNDDSSEEIIAPLRKTKLHVECDSEEECE